MLMHISSTGPIVSSDKPLAFIKSSRGRCGRLSICPTNAVPRPSKEPGWLCWCGLLVALNILVSSCYELHLFQQSQLLNRFVPSLHLELSLHKGALHVSFIGSSRCHATGACFATNRPSKREPLQPLQKSCKKLPCWKKLHQALPICTKCWDEKVSRQEHITSQRNAKPNHYKQKLKMHSSKA